MFVYQRINQGIPSWTLPQFQGEPFTLSSAPGSAAAGFFLFSDGLLLAKPAGGWIGGLVDVDSMDLPFEDWPWNFDLNGEIWMGRSLIVHKYN